MVRSHGPARTHGLARTQLSASRRMFSERKHAARRRAHSWRVCLQRVCPDDGDRNDGSRDGVRDPAAMLRAQKQCREAVEVDCLSCHFNSELPLREGVSIPNGHLHPRWVFPSVGTSIICTAACKWTAASGHRCTQVHRPGPNRCGRSEFYAEFLEILSKLFFQCFLLVGNEAPLGGRLVIGGPCRADRSGSQIAQVALSGSSIG